MRNQVDTQISFIVSMARPKGRGNMYLTMRAGTPKKGQSKYIWTMNRDNAHRFDNLVAARNVAKTQNANVIQVRSTLTVDFEVMEPTPRKRVVKASNC